MSWRSHDDEFNSVCDDFCLDWFSVLSYGGGKPIYFAEDCNLTLMCIIYTFLSPMLFIVVYLVELG